MALHKLSAAETRLSQKGQAHEQLKVSPSSLLVAFSYAHN